MVILTPSAEAGAHPVSGLPVPLATASKLVNRVTVKPRLGQWSKVLVGGSNLLPDESGAFAVLYPVPYGGISDTFSLQDDGGQNTIDLSQIYIYATVFGDSPMVEAFEYQTI